MCMCPKGTIFCEVLGVSTGDVETCHFDQAGTKISRVIHAQWFIFWLQVQDPYMMGPRAIIL